MFGPLLPFYELNGGLVAKSCPTVATPWTIAHQAPLSMGFSRHKYWSDLTFPSPWNLLNPGIEPESPALQADSLLTELPKKPGYELKADIIYFRMKVKEESEKAGLKLNIQKTKSLAFSTIPLWQINKETVETVTDFIFLGSKITADGYCRHEIKRHLLLGRKTMTNLDNVLKKKTQRHHFADKGPDSQNHGLSSIHVWI